MMSYCRPTPSNEILNACPPQQNDYHGMIADSQLSHPVSYDECSMQRDHSQPTGLQQDGYSNGSGDRWPVSGHGNQERSPDATFRSHYSHFDNNMTWQGREEVRTSLCCLGTC